MRRSRKKPVASGVAREEQRPATAAAPQRRQQPPADKVMQQQRKRHQDEVSTLTTKNYRLAKELADLRLKHRDECKNVTRLTMENMNLASRCREAISHVAMLKKELAMQQKRTAQALASQREQTKRMTDSLTNSFMSLSTPDSNSAKTTRTPSKSHRVSIGDEEDDNLTRLVSSTPSPDRTGLQHRIENDAENDAESFSRIIVVESSSTSTTSATTRTPSSPLEQRQDSPATTATSSPSDEDEDEDDTVLDSIALAPSTLSESPEKVGGREDKEQEQLDVYSTPKKSERPTGDTFPDAVRNDAVNTSADRDGLFPFSASPQVFADSNTNNASKSYDEAFPSDSIEQSDPKSQRRLNLMNSVDAFEQSFSIDFSDSFSPKEGNSSGPGEKIYNPFFATPEKQKSRAELDGFSTPKEEKKTGEPTDALDLEPTTPPKAFKSTHEVINNDTDSSEHRPKRPEKINSAAARARYVRALGPRAESSRNDKSLPAESNSNPTALSRRIQQKKLLDKNLQAISKSGGATPEFASNDKAQKSRNSIIDIVDAFEENPGSINDEAKQQKPSIASRFQGPIKSLRRRAVKKPISYAEPPLNTKLRRGDTFFPKTSPAMTEGDQNQAPNGISTTPIVSP